MKGEGQTEVEKGTQRRAGDNAVKKKDTEARGIQGL